MREWYLMNGINESASGYENGVFTDFGSSSFSEILQSYIAKDLILYNHDLSTQTNIRGVIQGNMADTQLKSMERIILCNIGTLSSGMYVYYEDAYWLVTGRPDNNGFYEKSTLRMCNWLLKWQNSAREIVQRWAVIESAAKYNDGENGNSKIKVGSDQFSIQIPLDSESIAIRRNVKFFIDYNTENPTVYDLTNPSNVLFHYGENNGITHWIVKESGYSPTLDDLVHGVCEYKEQHQQQEDDDNDYYIKIVCGNTEIKPGRSVSLVAHLYDESNNEVTSEVLYDWTINSTIGTGVTITSNENSATVSLASNCEDFGKTISVIATRRSTDISATHSLIVKEVF